MGRLQISDSPAILQTGMDGIRSLSANQLMQRPVVAGKFLRISDRKFWIRGVTYGTFRPGPDGGEFHNRDLVQRDLSRVVAAGGNAIRTYTVPPRWFLDAAHERGLRVMVGLPWEQHVAFLDDRVRANSIARRVQAGVRRCAGHPAVLCYAIGNEIPAPIVRWHGHRRVERYLRRLYETAKSEDPSALVTYVNYPSTEYLELPFADIVCANVYLEAPDRLGAYLARLQTVAADRPLLLTEIGLDSRRHGELVQADILADQVRAAFAGGCAGVFIFSWTDEWHRGGYEIEDWDFGLVTRDRRPKPALEVVRRAFAEVPFPSDPACPRISVVICSRNGARTIRDCLEGLQRLEYPNSEIIVVDDGSSDETERIAREFGVRLISTRNVGLGAARNLGLTAATGDIVAYLDDDTRPDPHWLQYLAASFISTTHAGIGGPNIHPPGDGPVADSVAAGPGNPTHVLLSDEEAEHIPGCNMAFRRACLEAIGGFDPRFRIAGDDVDVCWRIRQQGWTLGFNAGAMVWHHRRSTLRQYWRQQLGYGHAEALLEGKWPEKYNTAGHIAWTGRLYAGGAPSRFGTRKRIYYGTWGEAPYQSIYRSGAIPPWMLPALPEWSLVVGVLAGLSALGALWRPLSFALVVLAAAVIASVIQAGLHAARVTDVTHPRSHTALMKLRVLTAFLYLVQPLARLSGRLRGGLAPWRRRRLRGRAFPRRRTFSSYCVRWQSIGERLRSLEERLRSLHAVVLRGGPFDRWDLEVRDGTLGAVRLLMGVEEHGGGRQMVRVRSWPRWSRGAVALAALFGGGGLGAALDHAWAATAILWIIAALLVLRAFEDCAAATAAVNRALEALD